MVLTIEPGMEYAPGKMIVHEENVVITPDGAELLTKRAPRELHRAQRSRQLADLRIEPLACHPAG